MNSTHIQVYYDPLTGKKIMRPKGMPGFEIVVDPKTGKAFMKRQNLDDIDLSKLSPEERAKVLARRAKQQKLKEKLENEANEARAAEMAAKLEKLEALARKINEARELIERLRQEEAAARAQFESKLNDFEQQMRDEIIWLHHSEQLSKAFIYSYIESLFAKLYEGEKATKKGGGKDKKKKK